MSIAFESPNRYLSDSSLYTPSDNESPCVSSGSNTPFQTSSSINANQQNSSNTNSLLHQEFLNVIQARQINYSRPNASTGWTRKNLPQTYSHQTVEDLAPIDCNCLHNLMNKYNDQQILIIDVRSFSYYSQSRIRSAIHISIPSVLLKRPSYTLDKVCETIVGQEAAYRLKQFQHATHIIFYDHSSNKPSDSGSSATAILLGLKLRKVGFKGELNYLQGGFDTFSELYPTQCDLSPLEPTKKSKRNNVGPSTPTKLRIAPPTSIQLPPSTSINASAMNPFFSNIRQNLELSHGPLQERFPIRLPYGLQNKKGIISSTSSSPTPASFFNVSGNNQSNNHHPRYGLAGSSVDLQGNFDLPLWLKDTMDEKTGSQKLAEMYEELERTEQKRLSTIMKYHSQLLNNVSTGTMDRSQLNREFPLSIISSMEKGTLNRYNNIWPYEYSRVKLKKKDDDYINANYVQFSNIKMDITLTPIVQTEQEKDLEKKGILSGASLRTMNRCNVGLVSNRQYISTQGPLPATFNDFWQMMWDENSHVIVMLTKEMEMNKIKCHRYWPSFVRVPQTYGIFTVMLVSESKQPVFNMNEKRERTNEEDECIIIRKFCLKRNNSTEERIITHLQYTGWTDFGVPDHPIGLLQLVHHADKAHAKYQQQGPMVVHCSAGCGRSGTFCVIDTMIQRLWHEREVYTSTTHDKVWETVSRFREQRMSMVQTHRQFVFCYEAVLWWLLGYGRLPVSSAQEASSLSSVNMAVPRTRRSSRCSSSSPTSQFSNNNLSLPSSTLFPATPAFSLDDNDNDQTSSVGSIIDGFKHILHN